MFDQFSEGTIPTSFTLPTYQPDRLCHILLGDYAALVEAINRMAVLGYCDRGAWITPVSTGRSGEYISLTNRRMGGKRFMGGTGQPRVAHTPHGQRRASPLPRSAAIEWSGR